MSLRPSRTTGALLGADPLADREHAGTGAPACPVVNQPIDMSITYNGPVGSDLAEVQRQNSIQQDKGVAKVAAIDPGHH